MQTGRIILSGAALVVTALSAFSFKTAKRNLTQLSTSAGGCHLVSCYTLASGSNPNPCASGVTYYTASTCTSQHAWSGLKTITAP